MKVAKIKKTKEKEAVVVEDTYSIKNIIKIMVILFILFGLFYLITYFLVKDRKIETPTQESVIDSSKIVLGQLLNRSEKEYFVLATKSDDSNYSRTNYMDLYNNYINVYSQKDEALSFYYVDLNNALNKKYYSEELNITEEISNMKLNDDVLFRIKDGKINKTYVGKDKIIDKLSAL